MNNKVFVLLTNDEIIGAPAWALRDEVKRLSEEILRMRREAVEHRLHADGATHCPNCCNLCKHENCTETCPICNRPSPVKQTVRLLTSKRKGEL